MTRCTGACCQRFTLSACRSEIRRLIDDTRQDAASRVDAAKIWTLFREIEAKPDEWDHDKQRYRCVALTPSGCALERVDRPETCNRFPSSAACGTCGARSDQEARGVALERVCRAVVDGLTNG